ncbi:protein kinase [archaeon]|nr:MAG: protein kinase [archaeon]
MAEGETVGFLAAFIVCLLGFLISTSLLLRVAYTQPSTCRARPVLRPHTRAQPLYVHHVCCPAYGCALAQHARLARSAAMIACCALTDTHKRRSQSHRTAPPLFADAVKRSLVCCPRCSRSVQPAFNRSPTAISIGTRRGGGGPMVATAGGTSSTSEAEGGAVAAAAAAGGRRHKPSVVKPELDVATRYSWEIDPDKLKFKHIIGRGNFGEVWLASWLGSPVAVKNINAELQAKEKLVKRFIDEIMLMSILHHPNVVLFLGAWPRRPRLLLVLEYCSHGSLHHFLKLEAKHGITITMPLVYRFALDIARGVLYLHRRVSVVQRDLKARNILVDGSLNAKVRGGYTIHTATRGWARSPPCLLSDGLPVCAELWRTGSMPWRHRSALHPRARARAPVCPVLQVADFGLSRILNDEVSNKLTACGTPAWTAPEIVKMERYTEKVDVYSFGIILWELITKQEPYGGQKGVQIAYAAAEQGLRPEIPSFCPPDYAQLMQEVRARAAGRRQAASGAALHVRAHVCPPPSC